MFAKNSVLKMAKTVFSLFLSIFLVFDMQYTLGTDAFEPEEHIEKSYSENGAYSKVSEFRKKLYGFSDKIDMSEYRMTPSEFPRYISLVLKNDPFLFFLDGNFRYSCSDDGNINFVIPSYSMQKEEYILKREFCQRELKKIIYLIPDGADDFSKALFLHDYICENFYYDSSLECEDMYSFLKNGKGTCQGYTFTYTALLRMCNIECGFAASDGIMHIWNVLKLDGEWYHADLTWDDETSDRAGYAGHENFLCSDEEMRKSGHGEWYTSDDAICSSEKYRYFSINRINTPAAYLDGVWYVAENSPSSRSISVYHPEKDISRQIIKIKDLWKNQAIEGQYHISSHTSVVSLGKRLYYNTPSSVIEYDPQTGEGFEIYRAPEGKQIFGISERDGAIICCFDTQGSEREIIFSIALGDVNLDRKINVRDLTILSRKISEKDIFGQRFLRIAADIDLDGDMDSDDLEELRRIIVANS